MECSRVALGGPHRHAFMDPSHDSHGSVPGRNICADKTWSLYCEVILSLKLKYEILPIHVKSMSRKFKQKLM